MNKDSRKSKAEEGEKKKRKSTSKKDGVGKQKKKETPMEKLKANQTEKESETTSESKPPSPESNCSICLGDLQNKSFTDSCFHMFCFVCLKEWSKVKAECPLCKQKFKNIIYNVKSYDEYDRYNIADEQARNQWEHEGTRFRYRTTLTFERRLTFAPEHDYTQPIGRPSNVTTRSHWRRYRQPSTSEFRRRVYTNGMRALETTDRRLRVRDVTPGFFRRYPATTHRLVPWLNRELNSIIPNQPDNVQRVIEIIMGLIKSYSIDSEEFYQHIYPYVGRHTRHFMHEFLSFAKSPYNMVTYDSHVMYQPGAFTINSDSDDASVEDEDEIINIEDENSNIREPSAERRGNTYEEDLSPIFRSVRDILETESPGSYMHTPVAMSGWDSPTPGPSWLSEAPEVPLSCFTENVPVVGNRSTSPIDIGSSSDSDSDSTMSSASKGSDIVFVKMDKAWGERSPIMLSSDSSDTEKDMSANFVSKSKKRKSISEMKAHKKHKEHKRHKKSQDRESSKERSRHKKHKRHHSSDKSRGSSHSSSKHRDSKRSRSTSKHVDISSSKTSDLEDIRASLTLPKSKHKKHKKHKNHDHHKKSRSNGKMQSVIVLPNMGSDSVGKASSGMNSTSTDPLFPAASVMVGKDTLSSSSRDVTAANLDSTYKKHSSGHKKSSKLIDIVPNLLEKKLDQDGNNQKNEQESGKNSEHTNSNETKTDTKNLDKPFIPFRVNDDILSLENSRRCLKCGLLYIPELLDNFDVCFTCKKKKVCETESRSLSDVINELSKNHAAKISSSVPISNTFTENKNHTVTVDPEKDKPSNEDNIVIQEGDERSLRPALNHVDLTLVDAPLLDTTESDTDDCELMVTQNDNNTYGQHSKTNDPLCLDSDTSSQSPFENGSQKNAERKDDNSLAIDFSNPATPLKGSSQNSGRIETLSPMPWILEVSNPPTPSTCDWPGYMAPRTLNHTPESSMLESLFPKVSFDSLQIDPYGFSDRRSHSNSYFRSSYSPMSCSSVYHETPASIYVKPKPTLIDLDNDAVDAHSEEKDQRVTSTCSMSVSSSESICLSDTDDSVQSIDVCSEGKSTSCVDLTPTSSQFLTNLTQTGKDGAIYDCQLSHIKDNIAIQMSNENLQRTICIAERIDNTEDMELDKCVDEDMASVSQWKMDSLENQEAQINSDQDSLKNSETSIKQSSSQAAVFLEYASSLDSAPELSMSSSATTQAVKSLEEKLSGLTDFPPHVLESIDKGKRLSFHSLLSDVKSNHSSDCSSENSVDQNMTVADDNCVEKIPDSTTQDVVSSSQSMLVSTSNHQIDSLVGNLNENLNSTDRFEVDNTFSRPNSASMNSFCLSGNFHNVLKENSNCDSLEGLVGSVDSDSTEDGVCSSSTNLPLSFPLFTSNQSDSESGLNVADYVHDKPSTITMEENENSSLAIDEMKGLPDNNCVSSSKDSNINSDLDRGHCDKDKLTGHDQHDTDGGPNGYIDLHEIEFTSENCLFNESEDDNNTVEYRVDILHSEKQLSDNFANIFESNDSNDIY